MITRVNLSSLQVFSQATVFTPARGSLPYGRQLILRVQYTHTHIDIHSCARTHILFSPARLSGGQDFMGQLNTNSSQAVSLRLSDVSPTVKPCSRAPRDLINLSRENRDEKKELLCDPSEWNLRAAKQLCHSQNSVHCCCFWFCLLTTPVINIIFLPVFHFVLFHSVLTLYAFRMLQALLRKDEDECLGT